MQRESPSALVVFRLYCTLGADLGQLVARALNEVTAWEPGASCGARAGASAPWMAAIRGASYRSARGHVHDVICEAIRNCELLEFDYDGLHRIVAPYCHGFTSKNEVLRAVQVRGESRSRGMGFGKLWKVDKILEVRRTGDSFVPDDPRYNPNDTAMTRIHCKVRR